METCFKDMNKSIVLISDAKDLKELGFNWNTEYYYIECPNKKYKCVLGKNDNHNQYAYNYSAPTFEMVSKWLRDKNDIHIMHEYIRDQEPYPYKFKYDDKKLGENHHFMFRHEAHEPYYSVYEYGLQAMIEEILGNMKFDKVIEKRIKDANKKEKIGFFHKKKKDKKK